LLKPDLNVVSRMRTAARSNPAGFGVDGFGAVDDVAGLGLDFLLWLGEGLGDALDMVGVGLGDEADGLGDAEGFLLVHAPASNASVSIATSGLRLRTMQL